MAESAFEQFVGESLPALMRHAYALTGNVHAAEDLVQNTLVRLAGVWRRIDKDGNPLGYARMVMFRTYLSWWRSPGRPGHLRAVEPPSRHHPVAALAWPAGAARPAPRGRHRRSGGSSWHGLKTCCARSSGAPISRPYPGVTRCWRGWRGRAGAGWWLARPPDVVWSWPAWRCRWSASSPTPPVRRPAAASRSGSTRPS